MNTFRFCTIAICASLLVTTCTQNEQKPSTAADVEAIKQVREALVDAYDVGDSNAFSSQVTDDVIFMHPTGNTTTGRDQINEGYSSYFDRIEGDLSMSPAELKVVGGWAFEHGSFVSIRNPKDGSQSLRQDANYMIIWRRTVENSWKVARLIYVGDYKPLEEE